MPRELIITDDVNLELKDKSLLSHDSIYKTKDSKGAHINITDSKNSSSVKNGVYAILSVSDKVINNRLYDYESLKLNVMNGDWTKPYKKPFLRNHDLYYEPAGRIVNAWFIDHETMQVSCPDGQQELPEEVLKHYQDLKCFNEGTGSTIVEMVATEDTYDRIKNGLDATVSQSSYMGKATCNICHQDYFGGECTHFAGKSYQLEKDKETINQTCYVECKDFEPVELSIVNNPANDSSILFVLDSKKQSSKDEKEDKTQIEDSKIDNENINAKVKGTESNIKDCEHKDSQPEETNNKTEDSMFKDLLKKAISTNVSDKFGADSLESFGKLFDSLENEAQIENLQVFLDSLSITPKEVIETEEPETKDEKDEVEEPEVKDEKKEEEEKTEEETKDEQKEEPSKDETKTSEVETTKAEDLEEIFDGKTEPVVKNNIVNKKLAAMLQNL